MWHKYHLSIQIDFPMPTPAQIQAEIIRLLQLLNQGTATSTDVASLQNKLTQYQNITGVPYPLSQTERALLNSQRT